MADFVQHRLKRAGKRLGRNWVRMAQHDGHQGIAVEWFGDDIDQASGAASAHPGVKSAVRQA